ncbi:YihY/virulence factor BrkB family protein, partial [Streptomyces sp. SID625]|nr:YihY/virulence factor BrkB family protein [Streptomyces sp. SID625]
AATAAARAANERVREAQIAEYVARAAAAREAYRESLGGPDDLDDMDDMDETDDADMPSEFPERWSRFLPPEDVTARLRAHARSAHARGPHKDDSDGAQPDK